MTCPHCNTGIYEAFTVSTVVHLSQVMSRDERPVAPAVMWKLSHQRCPECHESIIRLERTIPYQPTLSILAYPSSYSRPITPEVPDPFRQEFSEACKVLAESAKASAALSRRCLQAILKDKLGAMKKDLYDEIEEVIASGKLPSHIVEGLHAVRNIGNIAAHSMKSTTTGAIIDVAPGEADWNLDVLESLFDFCFVQPALAAKRKDELNKKLKDINKPPIP